MFERVLMGGGLRLKEGCAWAEDPVGSSVSSSQQTRSRLQLVRASSMRFPQRLPSSLPGRLKVGTDHR